MDAPERTAVIARLAREHHDMLRALFAANDDLRDRVARLGVVAEYDPDEDYFGLVIGGPAEATTESLANTILFRVEPETLKLVGIEIYDFEKRRRVQDRELAALVEFWAPVVKELRAGRDPGPILRDLLGVETLRELVPA
jgi:hypothetical protein